MKGLKVFTQRILPEIILEIEDLGKGDVLLERSIEPGVVVVLLLDLYVDRLLLLVEELGDFESLIFRPLDGGTRWERTGEIHEEMVHFFVHLVFDLDYEVVDVVEQFLPSDYLLHFLRVLWNVFRFHFNFWNFLISLGRLLTPLRT